MRVCVAHDEPSQRFSTEAEGHLAVVDYRLEDGIMTITHTGVPGPVEGRGIAAQLVQAALDTARERGWRVVAQCAYADAYVRRHPQYADLLD
jgi:predicted GNAT family acetyltransferase